MRNLVGFIVRYHFMLLFLLLGGLSVGLLAGNNYYQRAAFGNISRGIAGVIFSQIESAQQYLRLVETNQALVRDNLLLRNQLSTLSSQMEAISLKDIDTSADKRYIFLPARVISNSVNKQYNQITLNVGKKQGVEVDMGVVTPSGVVGIVTATGENFSTVISVLNVELKISARVQRNRYFGSISWDGRDYRHVALNEIPVHVNLHPGDTIVTSGFSAIFPPELILGTVANVDKSSGNFLEVNVLLSADFKQLDNVWIVKVNSLNKEVIPPAN